MVVAHLSEGIPRFWLIDQVSLETFVYNELGYGLRLAVEAKVLADVNGTSGIQTQAYATSGLTTLRKCADQAGDGRLHRRLAGAAPHRLGRRRAGAVERDRHRAPEPAVRSGDETTVRRASHHQQCQAAGVGHVIAAGAVALDTDTRGVDVQWSENATADSFGKSP